MGNSIERKLADKLLLATLLISAATTGIRLGIQSPEHPDANDPAPAAETVPSPEESNIHHRKEPGIPTTPDLFSAPHFFEDRIDPPTPAPPENAISPIHGAF